MNGSQVQNPPSQGVTAQEIAKNLQGADDPLSFITQNIRPVEAPQATPVPRPQGQQSSPPAEPVIPAAVQQPPNPGDQPPPLVQDPPKEEEKNLVNQLLEETKPKKGPEDSIKDLRKKNTEYKTQIEEKEGLLAQLTEELEKYKTGEALPDVIKQKEERIAALERYEQLHALKLSPEYQKKYVDPLNNLKNKALTLAQEYDVDPAVLNEALEIDNKRELNSFLREHFDDVGVLEMREMILNIKDLHNQAGEAEKEPIQAFEKIKEEFQREQNSSENYRINTIINNARDGWTEALTELREKGEYPELTVTGDMEQDKTPAAIVQAAAEEFGKFVTLLGAKGVKELPKDVAKMLAKRFQLSQAATVTARSRAVHYQRSQDLLSSVQRQAPMIRPQVGGGITTGDNGSARPTSPRQAADQLLDQVLQKR